MAYNSMSVIGEAIAQKTTRQGVKQVPNSSNFSAPSVVEPVTFRPSGNREEDLMTVEVQAKQLSCSGTGYNFVYHCR